MKLAPPWKADRFFDWRYLLEAVRKVIKLDGLFGAATTARTEALSHRRLLFEAICPREPQCWLVDGKVI